MTTSSAEIRRLVSLIRAEAETYISSDSVDAADEIAGILSPGPILVAVRVSP